MEKRLTTVSYRCDCNTEQCINCQGKKYNLYEVNIVEEYEKIMNDIDFASKLHSTPSIIQDLRKQYAVLDFIRDHIQEFSR